MGNTVRILVTGSEGHIGRMQTALLREAGYEVRTFDKAAQGKTTGGEYTPDHFPGDLCDILDVRRAMQGMDAVVHLGALPNDRAGAGDQVLIINVQGTWNVLIAAVEVGVERVVYFSSINALGCVGGLRPPAYLPIDDSYPRHPLSPYQLSKHLAEETCQSFSERHGIRTVCLRPGYVVRPDQYGNWRDRAAPQNAKWGATELWGYVDLRDVCEATRLALTVENVTHDAFILFAPDIVQTLTTAELASEFYPNISWKQDRDVYVAANPHRSFMDCSHAKEVLGWEAKHSWRDTLETIGAS